MEINEIKTTTQDVFNQYMDAFLRQDLSDLAKNYREESILIVSSGDKIVGLEGIIGLYRDFFQNLEEGTTFSDKQIIIEQDIVFLEWTSESKSSQINDGVDTLVIRDGYIYAHTVKFNITPVIN
jgi:ketosteroid isomerase-like protein